MHGTPPTVNFPMIVISLLATAVCWGVYGPLLQWGHMDMGSGRLRPFICVGLAYLAIAVVGPVVVMLLTGMERGEGLMSGWTPRGIWWSFIAGGAGALGALGMILAFNFGGKPHYVPPLIFGLAPVVNTMFTLSMNPALREQLRQNVIQSSFFGAGLLMVAVGAVTVLVAAPKAGPPAKPTAEKSAANQPAKSKEKPEQVAEPKSATDDAAKNT